MYVKEPLCAPAQFPNLLGSSDVSYWILKKLLRKQAALDRIIVHIYWHTWGLSDKKLGDLGHRQPSFLYNARAVHYNYDYNCTKPHYIQQLWWWPLQPLQPLQKTQLQPPFGPSMDSLCLPWFTTTHLSYIVSYIWNFRHCLVRYYW